VNQMVSEWTTYRTRFLIKARQLDAPLTFVDCLGREHSGQKGDYLVFSSDGSQRIAPREIFEDIYVPMRDAGDCPASAPIATSERSQLEQQNSRTRPSEQTGSQSVLAQPALARSPQSSQLSSQRVVGRRSAAQVCLA
jgi:hypothetical protein